MTIILRSKRTRSGIRIFFREKYTINIKYIARTEITTRTIATAEAFGLGVDNEREFPVCDNVEINVEPNDVVYITGDSGSGKSSILRELEKIFGVSCVNLDRLEIDKTKPLVDTIGKTLEESFKLLSKVGLNDAFLFLRKYTELSDGQKYRYRLAKLIESGKPIWIADEFCSTLDRDTAKIVAFNVQKIARQLGKGLFVATCNTDLNEDLSPSVRINKRYGKEIQITYTENKPAQACSLVKEMRVEEGTFKDYKALCQFHYRNKNVAPVRKIFKLVRGDELCGVIVYSWGPIAVFGRRQAMGRVIRPRELNALLCIISRVVVHPKYRTIGLGVKIVKETLPLSPTPYTETVAVMAKYNPFFVKAGMTKVMVKTPDPKVLRAIHILDARGLESKFIASESYNIRKLKAMTQQQLEGVYNTIASNYHPRLGKHVREVTTWGTAFSHKGVNTRKAFAEGVRKLSIPRLAHLIHVLALLAQTSVYLIWKKPEVKTDAS